MKKGVKQYDNHRKNHTVILHPFPAFDYPFVDLPDSGVVKSMDVKTARKLFPDQTKNLNDIELQKYCDVSEVLSAMFIDSFKRKVKEGGIETYDKNRL